MQLLHCNLPLTRIDAASDAASNQTTFTDIPYVPLDCNAYSGNVRLMRRTKDGDNQRFALSGKLADVCAALDELAAQETRNAWRIAMH